ncbi:MAG: FprA family A-type flavoprotein [Bacteroidetes bacterium]|nr:FprA family A-type flavoprotein [Bacteroidota bacterium]MBU1718223.1 FprA family A-type flavoprotein [Bacteroidota bacterium]
MTNNAIHPITDNVSWVGALDPDIVTFDIVMETEFGTTYNSYFINAEKKTVVETVKEKFSVEFINKLKRLTDLTEIAYIVVDHTEPDHTGALKHLLKEAVNAKVVGSGNAIRYLKDIVGHEFPHIIVKDGDIVDLGNMKLRVIGAPNLHWPDSIYCYLEEEKLMFTCDSFGAHFCHEAIFDDLVGDYDAAFRYYFDVILKPFSKFMIKAIEKIRQLEIKAICPGHGPVLRSNWKKYVDLSLALSQTHLQKTGHDENRVLIAYVSAYGYTGLMANKIAEGLRKNDNIVVEVVDIEKLPLAEIDEKISRANAFIVGSPTINQNSLLQIYQMFALISPLRDRGKLAAAFGSYGWSGEAVPIIMANLKALKLNVLGDGLGVKFNPHDESVEQCVHFGYEFGKALLNKCNNQKSETSA